MSCPLRWPFDRSSPEVGGPDGPAGLFDGPLGVINTMSSDAPVPPKVFISYSHDSPAHKGSVRRLSDRLRREGIDSVIDQYESVFGKD